MQKSLSLALLSFFLYALSLNAQSSFIEQVQLDSCTVYFDFGASAIQVNSDSSLLKLVKKHAQVPSLHIVITAHTDAIGSSSANEKLSEKRAQSVIALLAQNGIPDSLIQWKIFGETQPTDSNDSDEGRQRNRRATIDFFKTIPTTLLKGQITDEQTGEGIEADVIIRSKMHRDSFKTAPDGSFERKVPVDAVIGIDAFAEGYFFENQMLKTKMGPPMELAIPRPKAEKGQSMALKNFFFVGNQDVLLPKSRPELGRLLRFMELNPTLKIRIEGHINRPNTSNVSKNSWDFDLSLRRAKTVYNFLIQNGIAENRMTFKGYGNWKMLFPRNPTNKQAEKNRRVEIHITDQ